MVPSVGWRVGGFVVVVTGASVDVVVVTTGAAVVVVVVTGSSV